MARLIFSKFLYGFAVLAGVAILVFFLFQGFGDPARLVLGQSGNAETLKNIRKDLALDQPKWKQFILYMNDLSPISIYSKEEIKEKNIHGLFLGNDTKIGLKFPYLRRSYQSKKSVSEILMDALPATLMLAFAAMFIATIFGIALGVLAAVKKGTWMDTTAIFTSVLGISVPSFFMGIVLAFLFGFLLQSYTHLHMTGSLYDYIPFAGRHLQLQNLVLPAITLGIRPMAIIAQLTRSSMLDVLHQNYIRTAYAKGLSKKRIIWNHVLRNALNPVMTAITGWFAELLAGAFFVEYIFGWNGVGKVTVDALEKLDFPVVMGSVLLTATFFVLVNMLADIMYGILNPRVRVH
ncbi:MAG: ABC transporter permease [Bacteroidetes bacterium]|nr:ABC transporter permease [Bacteroidota bacterium]